MCVLSGVFSFVNVSNDKLYFLLKALRAGDDWRTQKSTQRFVEHFLIAHLTHQTSAEGLVSIEVTSSNITHLKCDFTVKDNIKPYREKCFIVTSPYMFIVVWMFLSNWLNTRMDRPILIGVKTPPSNP